MELPAARTNVHLKEGETTAGKLGELLGVHYTRISNMLTELPDAPKPIRSIGRIRIFSEKEVLSFIDSKEGGLRVVLNEARILRRAKNKEPKRKVTTDFNKNMFALHKAMAISARG